MPAERLQKVLAAAGVASRRGSEALIAAGRVTVDGRPAVIGEQVDPAHQVVRVDGRPIGRSQALVHLACHKPAGVTSTVRDRHAAAVVTDLVPRGMVPGGTRLYPVGRLDRDSEGLLLLSNDGPWAERVLHPRYGVEREYAVLVSGPLGVAELRQLRAGIDLDEGLATLERIEPLSRADLDPLRRLLAPAAGSGPGGTWYRVVLTQGWRRQVRRMLGAVSVPVLRLVRTRIGPIELSPLRSGEVRRLTAREVRDLGRVSSEQ